MWATSGSVNMGIKISASHRYFDFLFARVTINTTWIIYIKKLFVKNRCEVQQNICEKLWKISALITRTKSQSRALINQVWSLIRFLDAITVKCPEFLVLALLVAFLLQYNVFSLCRTSWQLSWRPGKTSDMARDNEVGVEIAFFFNLYWSL